MYLLCVVALVSTCIDGISNIGQQPTWGIVLCFAMSITADLLGGEGMLVAAISGGDVIPRCKSGGSRLNGRSSNNTCRIYSRTGAAEYIS